MAFDSHLRRPRRSIRLADYDYASAGAYFVTICAHQRECLFSYIMNGEIRLSAYGQIVVECWNQIPNHFSHIVLDQFVVMPNHIHGIVIIAKDVSGGGAQHAAPLHAASINVQPGSLGAIIRSFKSAATKRINEIRNAPGNPIWQRNYYERVIRDEKELNVIQCYIIENPLFWADDAENPANLL